MTGRLIDLAGSICKRIAGEQKTTRWKKVGNRICAKKGARKWIDDLQVVRYHLLPANLILVPIAERCD